MGLPSVSVYYSTGSLSCNGRLSRIIAERCLAEAEHTNLRLFSLPSAFETHRNEYYQQF